MSEERGRGRGRGGDKDKGKGDAPRRGGGFFRRRRVCKFCAEKIDYINYKDVRILAPFLPERGKIQPRRISGTCAMHQRKLQTAIKRARQLALIPYVTDELSTDPTAPHDDHDVNWFVVAVIVVSRTVSVQVNSYGSNT
jgi:small subunit ribosomal protein S18